MIEKITNFLLDKLKIKNEKIKKLIPQIIKFIIVGGIAFVIDYGVMVLCKEVFHLNVYLSAFLGFTISVIYNYIASVSWVFDVNKDKNKVRNFILFVIFSVIGLGLTELIMYIGVDLIKISYLIVKIAATIIVMIFNFITRKLFLE
jgi:putative flippase GtrA